jgi:hypothetical protein
MIPYEREIYVSLLSAWLKEEKDRHEQIKNRR